MSFNLTQKPGVCFCLTVFLVAGIAGAKSSHKIEIASGPVVWSFNTEKTLALASLTDQEGDFTHTLIQHESARPLFEVTLDAVLPADSEMNAQGGYDWQAVGQKLKMQVTEVDSRVVACQETLIFKLAGDSQEGRITGLVQVAARGNGEVLLAPEFGCEDKSKYVKGSIPGISQS